MADGLRLDIDSEQIARLALDLAATEAQAERALLSTLGRMSKWLRAESIRQLSKHLRLAPGVIRRRLKAFRLRKHAGGAEVTVWYGLNPIALVHLAKRPQSRRGKGVRFGTDGRVREGAFFAKGRGGSEQVFKRRGGKRLPIDRQELDLKDDAQIYIEDNLLGTDVFDRKFLNTYERELRWRTGTRK